MYTAPVWTPIRPWQPVYIDSKDEDYTDAYKWLLYSEMVRDQVDEELQKNGFEPFDKEPGYHIRGHEGRFYVL